MASDESGAERPRERLVPWIPTCRLPHLLALDPQARVVVASGYSTGPVMTDYQRFGFVGAIPKPFEVRSLGAFLRHLLGSRARSAKGGAAV